MLNLGELLNGHVGVHILVNECVTLHCGDIVLVEGEHLVEALTGLAVLLGIHEHLAAEHEAVNIHGVGLFNIVSALLGSGIVVVLKEEMTNGEEGFLVVLDLLEEFGEVLVGCIGVGQLVIYDQLSHCLVLGVEFGHIVAFLLGAGTEAANKQQGSECCCANDVLLHY